jgi:hypothetical protein
MRTGPAVMIALSLALAACASTPQAQVLRFHQGQPISRGTIAIQPANPAMANSLEFNAQANAVGAELQRQGFTVVKSPAQAQFVAIVSVETGDRLQAPRRSGVSVGIGGGFSSGNVGVGTSVNVPVGGQQQANVATTTTLSVAITQGAGGPAVWEGRSSLETQAGGQSGTALTPILASTLFKDFPGPSGQTVRVPIR